MTQAEGAIIHHDCCTIKDLTGAISIKKWKTFDDAVNVEDCAGITFNPYRFVSPPTATLLLTGSGNRGLEFYVKSDDDVEIVFPGTVLVPGTPSTREATNVHFKPPP